jgi:hypothetical protein
VRPRLRVSSFPSRSLVTPGIAAVAAAAIALLARHGSTPPPGSVAPSIVTGPSQLDATGSAGAACGDARRQTSIEPGFVDLATLAPRVPRAPVSTEAACADPWPDVVIEVVRAADGAPVPAAEVVVSNAPDPAWQAVLNHRPITTSTDAHGLVTIRAAGRFDVAARADGLGWMAACVERRYAELRDPLRLELEPCVVLALRVVDDRGLPVAGAQVRGFGIEKTIDFVDHSPCGNPAVERKTDLGMSDRDGRVAPVECVRGRKVAFLVAHETGSWMLPAVALDKAAGSTQTVELRLPALARVAGVVHRADGSPSCELKLVFERRFDAWCDTTDEFRPCDDGRFALSLGPPGRYRVTTWSPSDEFGWIERERRELTLPAGETFLEFVDPDPPPPPSEWPDEVEAAHAMILGHVVADVPSDPDAPRRSGDVRLVRDGSIVEHAQPDDDGSYRFDDVAPGTYALIVLVDGCTRRDLAPFEVAAASVVELPDVAVAALPPIRGRVVGPDRRPIEGVSVTSEATTLPSTAAFVAPHYHIDAAKTDDAGAFEVALVSGSCRLCVHGPGVVPFVVPLPEQRARDPVEIVVPATRALRGRIVVTGGLPDVKRQVTVFVALSRERRAELGDDCDEWTSLEEVEVGADGDFEFARVPCSEFELAFWVNTSGWETIGCTVARRAVGPGAADVDLGDWVLATETR